MQPEYTNFRVTHDDATPATEWNRGSAVQRENQANVEVMPPTQYVTGDGRYFDSVGAASKHARTVFACTGHVIGVQKA